jgi:hypothetical protein
LLKTIATPLVVCLTVAVAQAAAPRLENIQPQGGQRGKEVTVTFFGGRIAQEPQQVLFYEPGITAKSLERGADDHQLKAVLSIAPDCEAGIHGVRVRTATGLTNLRTFHVGTLPEIEEKEPNNAFEKPQPIELGCVVNGVVTNEDVDYFVVEAKEGERLSVEVEGLRLGRTFFDPALTIFDEKRFEMAVADDSTLLQQDCYATVKVPKAGKYIIELRETSFQGDGNCSYRLHVGKFPRPAAAFPGGGPSGKPLEVRWLGDPLGERAETVTLPQKPGINYRLAAKDDTGEAPTGVPMRIVDVPNVLEKEPNNKREEATKGDLPAAFCGIIGEAGDSDHFRFAAKKGEVYDFSVIARTIRSRLDPVLYIRKADGAVIASADDNGSNPDPYLRFTIPEDGEYTAEVFDHLHSGGPTYLYRLEVTKPSPAVDLVLEERVQYEALEMTVPQGNRMAYMVTANRADVGGEMSVGFGDLPAGVTEEKFPLAADYNRLPVLLKATPEAALTAVLPTVTAELVDKTKSTPILSRFKQQTWLIRGSNNVPVWNHWADHASLAVVQPIPYTLKIVEPKAPLVQSGTKDLHVVAERKPGFDGRIAIRMLYDPPGLSSHQGIGIEPGHTDAAIPLTTPGNAWARDWKIIVVGEADVNGAVRAASEFATLKITAPFLAMTFPPANTEQGKDIPYNVAIETKTPFEGSAKVELVGLPPGVTSAPQQITKDSKEVIFPLTVAKDARVGHHKQLYCQVTITEKDEPVLHTIGPGELRIDAPLPKPQTAQQPAAPGASS